MPDTTMQQPQLQCRSPFTLQHCCCTQTYVCLCHPAGLWCTALPPHHMTETAAAQRTALRPPAAPTATPTCWPHCQTARPAWRTCWGPTSWCSTHHRWLMPHCRWVYKWAAGATGPGVCMCVTRATAVWGANRSFGMPSHTQPAVRVSLVALSLAGTGTQQTGQPHPAAAHQQRHPPSHTRHLLVLQTAWQQHGQQAILCAYCALRHHMGCPAARPSVAHTRLLLQQPSSQQRAGSS